MLHKERLFVYNNKNKRSEGEVMNHLLKRAQADQTPIEIIYINGQNQLSQRVIKVLSVNDASIKAYCYTKRQFRIFKRANILSVGQVRRGA